MADMSFERVTMGTLFTDHKNLAVPTYQRGYAWTNQEWEDFWNDLAEVLDENEEDHFLGQVVTNKLDSNDYVVDGQQRVTTSTIFLAVLRDSFTNLDSERARMRAQDLQKKYIGRRGHFNFTQAEQVADFFSRLIQNEAFSFNEVKGQASQDSERNFVKAYDYLYKRVAERIKDFATVDDRVEFLEDLQDAFLDHMFVMKISTPDEASAFVIFETLNARGRDLNSSDLLKNHLFRKASGDPDIQRHWEEMMTPLDFNSDRATKFIRAYWNGTHDFVTEKKLYRALNRSVVTKSDATRLVQKLSDLSDEFASMLDPKNQISFHNETLINNLYILNQLGAKTFYPLILVMVEKEFDETEIGQVLHKIISFTIRNFTIGGLVANKFEKSFANIARQLSDGKIFTVNEINSLIAEEMVDDQKFENDLALATLPTEKTAKYVLSELAYPNDENKIVLPDVKVTYINENVENKDRIGNKLLVTKEEAKAFKDSASRKAETIANSKFEGTRTWANKLNVMTSEEIDARQQEWIKAALLIWSK